MRKLSFMALILLLALPAAASAATISGNVYHYDLRVLHNVKIDINTTPHQTIIATDGHYEFEVPEGTYSLVAKKYGNQKLEAIAEETVYVEKDGNFVLDLILFPVLDEETDLLEEDVLDLDTVAEDDQTTLVSYLLTAIGIVFFIFIIYYTLQARNVLKNASKKSDIDEQFNLEDQVLEFIKKNGGSATQKEIRKAFPLSEAKISLVLSGLEVDNKIVKNKVGRGNIVRLKK